MPNGQEEQEKQRAAQQAGESVELQRRLGLERETRGTYYPLEGQDFIEMIKEATAEDLPRVIREALAFKEGLPWGIEAEDYDLERPEVLTSLLNFFTTVEHSTKRPTAYYLDPAINERLDRQIRDIRRQTKKEQRELTGEEEQKMALLRTLNNQVEAREIIDRAFLDRMLTCESDEAVAMLLYRTATYGRSVKPEREHWRSLFRGELGQGIDKVLRKIVESGMRESGFAQQLRKVGPEGQRLGEKNTVYVEGFKTRELFQSWLSELLTAAEGKMDVVWLAWKLALIWEIPSELGVGRSKSGQGPSEVEHFNIGNVPIVSDIATAVFHTKERRMNEWGFDTSGRRIGTTKHPTHTGYPLSIDKIPGFYHDYLQETEVGSRSLWKIWWEEGKNLTDPTFPWGETEGSFAKWLDKRVKAWRVYQDLISRPPLKDLGDPDFFASRVRNWDRVFRAAPKDLDSGKNPRVWWVAGLLMAHHMGETRKIPLVSSEPDELAYRTYWPGEIWAQDQRGQMGSSRNPSVWEILNHAYQCGFLRREDIDWLTKSLNLPKPSGGGAGAY